MKKYSVQESQRYLIFKLYSGSSQIYIDIIIEFSTTLGSVERWFDEKKEK